MSSAMIALEILGLFLALAAVLWAGWVDWS